MYGKLYKIVRHEIFGDSETGRFGALEAFINREGYICFSKIIFNKGIGGKITNKTIWEMLDALEKYRLFPVTQSNSTDVEYVRVYIPLFRCEEIVDEL